MNTNTEYPNISLIISTYNWEDALYLCLESVAKQTLIPNEIIIADDGSGANTKIIIDDFRRRNSLNIIHVWHKDKGFRLAKIRNRAILKSKSDYIIQIDGDLILNKHFVSDHLLFAKKNHFVRGSRVRLGQQLSEKLLITKSINFSFFDKDIKSRLNGFRNYFLAKIFAKSSLNPHKMLGCNMAYWRADALAINGYENLLVGWGHEDEEFAARLVNNNIAKIRLKYHAFVNHLYHIERQRNNEKEHYDMIHDVLSGNKKTAINGINELD